ncbi:uncharacterized protein LOC123426235 isoform X2 [Hordeum vulgare subsp. vulgare]|nr:uncharacterized protein LOC123426235 isoform X2 [Hordeum vulgare subsp. vulgare]
MPPRHPMPSMDATTAMAQGRTKGWSSRLGTAVRMLAPVRAVMAWWQKKVVFPRSRVLAGVSIRGLARKTGIISSGQAATNDARSQCRRYTFMLKNQTNKSHEMLNTRKIFHHTATTVFCSVVC